MVVYALGALPGDAQLVTLRTALEDAEPDVRWNAAVALARKGRHEGVPVLRQMLDRQYVEQQVKREVRQDEDQDPIADVMISGLRAAATLKDESLQALGDGPQPAGPQHEGPAGGARSAQGDGITDMADETNT